MVEAEYTLQVREERFGRAIGGICGQACPGGRSNRSLVLVSMSRTALTSAFRIETVASILMMISLFRLTK